MIPDGHADERVDVVVVSDTFVASVVGNEDELMPAGTHENRRGDIPALVHDEKHHGKDDGYSGNIAEVGPVVASVEALTFQFKNEVLEGNSYLIKPFLAHGG